MFLAVDVPQTKNKEQKIFDVVTVAVWHRKHKQNKNTKPLSKRKTVRKKAPQKRTV